MKRLLPIALVLLGGCSDEDPANGGGLGVDRGPGTGADQDGGPDATLPDAGQSDAGRSDAGDPGDASLPRAEARPELWYAVDDLLVRVVLDPADGSVAEVQTSTVVNPVAVGQNALTMLASGALLGARLRDSDQQSEFYVIPSPPLERSQVTIDRIGIMPDDIRIEGLYSDCVGRIYAMDTGVNNTSAEGNRLLRFTGDVLAGDFKFEVVSDLGTADVADIDDLSPGIDDNIITDNPGLALDTGDVYRFNYETGTGTQIATAGTYGIHALGGPVFDDDRARLYVLSAEAELFEVDPVTFSVSDALATGPIPDEGFWGWSGLAGPLTECDTGFGRL